MSDFLFNLQKIIDLRLSTIESKIEILLDAVISIKKQQSLLESKLEEKRLINT